MNIMNYYQFFPHHLRFFVALLLGLLLPVIVSPEKALSQEVSKSVLYINSYHQGYPWSDTILEGISKALYQSDYKIELQIEYLDAKKFNVEPVLSAFYQLHKEKFQDQQFDVVIVSDDDAFHYAIKYRSQLFPGVPIVFCGVNDLSGEQTAVGNITGIVENFDLIGTIDVALNLHPEKKRMIVVGDNSTAGQAIKSQIESFVPQFQDRLTVDFWVQVDLDDVQKRVKTLPADTFLFFIPYFQVSEDYMHSAEEVMEAIYSYSNVPIYTGWEFLIGHGAVGGSLLSGGEHGRAAAQLSLEILGGEDPDRIPIIYEPNGLYMFDYQVMERLGIDESMLPSTSRIINAPSPFYQLARELLWTIVVSFLLLVVALLFLSLNMIARRKVERTIKDQLTFQQTLIDTIPLLVSWKDVHGDYVGVNLAFSEFFGLGNITEVVGKSSRDVVSDDEYVTWSIDTDSSVVSENKEFRRVRKRITSADGESAWLELSKVPIRDRDRKITGVLTTAENITREQNLEKQLIQSQKMEAIGTLAGGIAHDFNNILTSIINSTELAVSDVDPESQTKKDLDRVLKAARRGSRVVKQILTFSRPSQHGFRSTDLEALVYEVINLMEVSLPGSVKIKYSVSPGLRKIHADPTQLHQAIMNLCTNAFHELKETGGEIHLSLKTVFLREVEAGNLNLEPGNFVKITIGDNGPGIKPEIIDKIFDPFFSLKDKTEGSGLGLTVVLGIVKGHNGGVRVRSEYGKGTTFDLFLPDISSVTDAEDRLALPEDKNDGSILFVEDDEDQLQTTPRILRSLGYQVESSGDSREAAAKVKYGPDRYDLLITDYDMPGMNGIDLVKKIMEYAPHLRVIMISGREEAVAAAKEIAAIRYVLVKPYDKNELSAMINSILRKDGRL